MVCCLFFQSITQSELSLLRSLLEEEKFKVDRLEDQLNDLTELHQHEMGNLKQDMASIEEKIEYRLDERTTDLNDLVDSCQTKVRKLLACICVTDWSATVFFT
jgi:chromosome segregation ATPase